MTNQEKIIEGMKLIKEGCSEQTEWRKCYDCPFSTYCELMEEFGYEIPSEEF